MNPATNTKVAFPPGGPGARVHRVKRDEDSPACPRCHELGNVRATLRVSLGTYYSCDLCNHLWCSEKTRADVDSALSVEQVQLLRRLRRALGFDKRPKIH